VIDLVDSLRTIFIVVRFSTGVRQVFGLEIDIKLLERVTTVAERRERERNLLAKQISKNHI
jgi:hypothetical protein